MQIYTHVLKVEEILLFWATIVGPVDIIIIENVTYRIHYSFRQVLSWGFTDSERDRKKADVVDD